MNILWWIAEIPKRFQLGSGRLAPSLPPPPPDLLQSTSPDALTRLTLRVDTALGPRTILTSALPRREASALAQGLAQAGIVASLTEDHGVHTVKELVRRKRQRADREAKKVAKASPTNVTPLRRNKP